MSQIQRKLKLKPSTVSS